MANCGATALSWAPCSNQLGYPVHGEERSQVQRPFTNNQCSEAGETGELEINGSNQWQNDTDENYNVVHRVCLSILCRRLDVTPEEWWASFYGPKSEYLRKHPYGDNGNRLKRGLRYAGMEGRNGQFFDYAIEHNSNGVMWWDPQSYEPLNWLLASPTVFPRVLDLPIPLDEGTASSPGLSQTASQKVFFTTDLLFAILNYTVPYFTEETWTNEVLRVVEMSAVQRGENGEEDKVVPRLLLLNDPHSLVGALTTLFSLLLVNKRVHNLIKQQRQDLFFRIIWQYGWMLPACPADWKSWNDVNDPLPSLTGVPIEGVPGKYNPDRVSSLSNVKNWYAYVVHCTCEEEPHIKNRYRFHHMLVQHARGLEDKLENGERWKWWSCGRFGVGTALECPTPYEWEKDEWVN